MFSVKTLDNTVKWLLWAALFITPLLFVDGLYFPFLSSKTYTLRLLIGIALPFWALLLFRSKIHRPRFSNLLIVSLLIFLAGYIVTGFLGVDPVRSFFSTTERSDGVIQFAVWTVYFLMAISVFRTGRDWQTALGLLIAAGFLSSVYGLSDIRTQYKYSGLRIFGTFGNPSFLGAFLVSIFGFTALFLAKVFSPFPDRLKNQASLFLAALMAFFAAMIIMTQTRGDYIGLLGGILVFAVLMHFFPGKNARLKKLILALDIILVALFAFIGFVLTNPNASIVRHAPLLQRIANSVESNSVNERLAEWQMAIKGFEDKPLLGWGAENFGAISNKYYDYRIGLIDEWFDRPHNQTLQILAEGGVALFAGYLFLLAAILFCAYKVFKKDPIAASIAAAAFVGYLAQDFFLFDTFATYICFFTLLGLLYYLYEHYYPAAMDEGRVLSGSLSDGSETAFFGVAAVASLAFLWYTVSVPYFANPYPLKFNAAIDNGALSAADEILNQSVLVTSPYLALDIKKAAAWEVLSKVLLDREVKAEDKPVVLSLYKKITAGLEELIPKHPHEPQMYYLLGSFYRIGYEQLGIADGLMRSEAILKQALTLSPTRIEYVDAMSRTLLDEKKFDELDALIQRFISQIDPGDSYRYLSLGNYYFLLGKYDLAFGEYEKALERGYTFIDSVVGTDYDRYLQAAQETKNFEKAAKMIQLSLDKKGPSAANYFNLAVAKIKLGRIDEAKRAYQEAMKLEPDTYHKYEKFFR